MIETKVPKDIRKFKGKAIGPFSLRQVICILIAAIVDFFVYSTFLKTMELSSDSLILILMTCSLPILVFVLEPNGMKMEVYLKEVLYKNLFYPTKRKIKVEISNPQNKTTEAEMKRINKEYQVRIKNEPEWKMYE